MNAASPNTLPSIQKEPLHKKRVLVIYSKGGGGHKAAGEAITEALTPEYEVVLVNGLTEALPGLDFLYKVTGGRYSGEDLYNLMLRNGCNRLVYIYGRMGEIYMALHKKSMQKTFAKYLDSLAIKPDLIISVVPFTNGGLAPVALEKNIPFLLIPTDLEISTFLVGLSDGSLFRKKGFKLALPYEDSELKHHALEKICLDPSQTPVIGFPVRAACIKKYTPEEIAKDRDHFNLGQNNQIITLILGAAGGTALIDYTLEIAKLDKPNIECNICSGRNEKVARKIVKELKKTGSKLVCHRDNCYTLQTPHQMLIHVRGFVKELPALMACSDLIISKTGSCSVNEVIYLQKPLLLDDTPGSSSQELPWESYNVPFVKKHSLGDAFTSVFELNSEILQLLSKKQDLHSSQIALPNFQANLKQLAQQMIG